MSRSRMGVRAAAVMAVAVAGILATASPAMAVEPNGEGAGLSDLINALIQLLQNILAALG